MSEWYMRIIGLYIVCRCKKLQVKTQVGKKAKNERNKQAKHVFYDVPVAFQREKKVFHSYLLNNVTKDNDFRFGSLCEVFFRKGDKNDPLEKRTTSKVLPSRRINQTISCVLSVFINLQNK